jgi:hypothetical protein
MLRRILLVCVFLFVATPYLWAQDASPSSSQACDSRELTESLTSTDPLYAETVELTKELENRGYVVRFVLQSKLANAFPEQLGAALYRTSRGDFEVLFLTKPRTFDSARLVEHEKNGFYTYSLQGIPPGNHTMHMQCGRRNFFAKHANRLFITQDSMQLAADLGAVLNSI